MPKKETNSHICKRTSNHEAVTTDSQLLNDMFDDNFMVRILQQGKRDIEHFGANKEAKRVPGSNQEFISYVININFPCGPHSFFSRPLTDEDYVHKIVTQFCSPETKCESSFIV